MEPLDGKTIVPETLSGEELTSNRQNPRWPSRHQQENRKPQPSRSKELDSSNNLNEQPKPGQDSASADTLISVW